jgi:hypothetical protein
LLSHLCRMECTSSRIEFSPSLKQTSRLGCRGHRFEIRKNVLALVETNARASFPPIKITIFLAWDAITSESRCRALYARSPPTPKLRNVTRRSPSLRCSSMIQLNAYPFPAVLLEPRHATIKDGSPMDGDGSAWRGGFCGLIMCFRDKEDKRISPSKQTVFIGCRQLLPWDYFRFARHTRLEGDSTESSNWWD